MAERSCRNEPPDPEITFAVVSADQAGPKGDVITAMARLLRSLYEQEQRERRDGPTSA